MKLYLVSEMFGENDEKSSSNVVAPLRAESSEKVDAKGIESQLGSWVDKKLNKRIEGLNIPKPVDMDRLQNDLMEKVNDRLESMKKELMKSFDGKLTSHDADIQATLMKQIDEKFAGELKSMKSELEKSIEDSMKANSSMVNIDNDPAIQAAMGNMDQNKSIVDPQEYDVRDANEDEATSMLAEKELADKKKKAEETEKEAHQNDLDAQANEAITKVAAEAQSNDAIKSLDDDAADILGKDDSPVSDSEDHAEESAKADEKQNEKEEKSTDNDDDDLPFGNDDDSEEVDESEEVPEDETSDESEADKDADDPFQF